MSENRPGQAETRKLAAIMFTDIVGFSRQMGADETRTLRLLAVHNQAMERAIAAHHGHVIKTFGDAFLVDFPSVVHAVQCAQHVQAQFLAHNTEKELPEQIHIRIGIHLGDIVVQPNGDVLGDGVNIASRLQTFAEPDTICISRKVYEEVEKKLILGTVVSLGRPKLKNIAERFEIYALLSAAPKGFRQNLHVQRLKFSRRVRPVVLVFVSVTLVAGIIATRYFPLLFPNPQPPTPSTQSLPLPDKPSIVVLPFANMSEDSKQDYFSDGITEDITSSLSKISSLFVIARNSAFTYRGKATKVQEISREMGVRYVLEGSVQKTTDQVRITAQLIDATTGEHLWSERYDRPFKDIFALQDEIVLKIATTLKFQLTLMEQGILVRKRTENIEAYDYYLRGTDFFFRFTKETNFQAQQLFEKSIALDPQYAEAYARLGFAYYLDWQFQWNPDPQNLEQAFTLAQKAVALDGSSSVAHRVLGLLYLMKAHYEQAMTEAERLIALDPNSADGYVLLGDALNFAGRSEEAVGVIEKALRLNPRPVPTYFNSLGAAYLLTDRYTEAIAALKQTLNRSPNFLWTHTNLAVCYIQQWSWQLNQDPHLLEQALAAVQRADAISDSMSVVHSMLGFVHLWQKQYDQALMEVERAVALGPNDPGSHMVMATVLMYIGRPEEAIKAVEKARSFKSRYPLPYAFSLTQLGEAYFLTRRYEEAIVALKQVLDRNPHHLPAHLTLAAVYSELGREAEAQAEAAEVLRINPKFSLEVHKERTPIKDPAMLERHIAALRKAGLK
ncbi:MAG: tetratricopeptide repeat protein [Deltaproteobacteria bacterium]|nr:tetratricopeptide repeat protein [Deltaproteobacteria bacterium]